MPATLTTITATLAGIGIISYAVLRYLDKLGKVP